MRFLTTVTRSFDLHLAPATLLVPLVLVAHPACFTPSQQVHVFLFPHPDQPVHAADSSEWVELERVMAPYVAQARASWPEVKQRYLIGLPDTQSLYVVARLRDTAARVQQVFVHVELIQNGYVTGLINSDIHTVTGHANGAWYALSEAELVDWVILHSDGTEEGNVVGKCLDQYRKTQGAVNR